VLGGLVFKTGPELEWFRKRFSMFQDILSESWVYQEIGQKYFEQGFKQGFEQGLEQGREKERQRWIPWYREFLIKLVEVSFADLTIEVQQQANSITNLEILHNLILKLIDAQTIEEARQVLFNIDKSEALMKQV
jgi:flagellar biosynthesis/type III secretory pathway protein FliH